MNRSCVPSGARWMTGLGYWAGVTPAYAQGTATNSHALQRNANLANPGGWATSGYAIRTANGTNSISITSPAGSFFFHWRQPFSL